MICAWNSMFDDSMWLSVGCRGTEYTTFLHVKFTATTVQIIQPVGYQDLSSYGIKHLVHEVDHAVPSSAKLIILEDLSLKKPLECTVILYVIYYKFLLHISIIRQTSGRSNLYMWTAQGWEVDRSEWKLYPLVGFVIFGAQPSHSTAVMFLCADPSGRAV